jgi:flagella basal body P-ring formation protein FlgA
MRIKYTLWLSAIWIGWTRLAVAQDAAAWQLVPEAKVDSTGIFLSQLVAPSPSSVATPTPVVLPHIRLAPAPPLGQTVSFTRAQVTELLRNNTPELAATNWSGAARVRVSRRIRAFTEYEMTSMLTKALQNDYLKDRGELELHLSRPLAAFSVPDEPLTLKIVDAPAGGVAPVFVVHCELWNDKERVGDWQLPVQAKLWREIPMANSRLNRGQLLGDADIAMERSDVLVQRDALLSLSSDNGPLELTENIPAGMPVLNRSVRVRPVVRRGRLVEGVFQEGSLSISLKVEVLEDGLLGQTVRVRNPKTKRELNGKVQNEQTVLISL